MAPLTSMSMLSSSLLTAGGGGGLIPGGGRAIPPLPHEELWDNSARACNTPPNIGGEGGGGIDAALSMSMSISGSSIGIGAGIANPLDGHNNVEHNFHNPQLPDASRCRRLKVPQLQVPQLLPQPILTLYHNPQFWE